MVLSRTASLRGFTAPGRAGMRVAASAQEIAALRTEINSVIASSKFVSRVRAVGYTDDQLARLAVRIEEYSVRGQIGMTSRGGLINPSEFLVGKSSMYGRAGVIRHELTHLLQEIANPGILARGESAKTFGLFNYARVEVQATRVQLGVNNPAAFWLGGFTASVNRFGVVGGFAFTVATGVPTGVGLRYLVFEPVIGAAERNFLRQR